MSVSALGPYSSTSELLHGMRFPGSKHPGERVIKSTHKGPGNQRTILYYGGRREKTTKRRLYELARDRGFDVSHRRFQASDPATKAQMIKGSLEWQGRAQRRWLSRMDDMLSRVTSSSKKKRLQAQRKRLASAPVRSPHLGHAPVSAYLRRYWP